VAVALAAAALAPDGGGLPRTRIHVVTSTAMLPVIAKTFAVAFLRKLIAASTGEYRRPPSESVFPNR